MQFIKGLLLMHLSVLFAERLMTCTSTFLMLLRWDVVLCYAWELWSAALGVSELDKDVLLLECFSIIAFLNQQLSAFGTG